MKNASEFEARTTTLHDERYQALLQAAYAQIADKGFEGLRLREIAAAVGINQATIHYYFPTKEALIQGVVAYTVSLITATTLAAQGEGERTPLRHLHAYLSQQHHMLVQAPIMFRVICELLLRAARDPNIAPLLVQVDHDWQDFLTTIFEQGVQQKDFRPDLNPRHAAHIVMAFLKGMTLQLHLQPDDVAASIAQLEHLFLHQHK
jgi:AcrR family transcriptional regulator